MGAVISAVANAASIGTAVTTVIAGITTLWALMTRPPAVPAPMPQSDHKTDKQFRDEARKELGIDTFKSYNFGISGATGTGKSSLINAVRGIVDGAPGAAKVGYNECTQKISPFPFSKPSHIILWDMPGGGTNTHKAADYFMDKKLYAFDMIILTVGNRFTETDMAIAKGAQHEKIPIAFVRSMSDQAIDSESRRLKKKPANVKLEVKQNIISYIKQQLPNELRDREIFVINSRFLEPKSDGWDPKVYALDEQKLIQYVLQAALSRRMPNFCRQ